MSNLYYPDWQIRRILREADTVAMVGASTNWNRPSYFAMKYLQAKGYRVIPVNPRADEILGEKSYPSLSDIPVPVDIVDIFRRPEQVGPIVEEAAAIGAKVAWMQLTVINEDAAAQGEALGLTVIMDRCMKIEYGRLSGELGFSGVNTRVITSRRTRTIRA